MSVDCWSWAIIGCKVPGSKMYKSVKRYHSEHGTSEGAIYCQVCGEPMFQTVRKPIFDEDRGEINGLSITWGTDREEAYIGLVVDKYISIDPEEFGDIVLSLYHKLRSALLPFGLWNDDAFGIHSVLYCSY